MKITFFGYDYTMDIAQRLMQDGHEIMQIFTFPCDNQFSFNTQIKAFANHFNIPITENDLEPTFIRTLVQGGCDLFLCCGYTKKIPDIDENEAYGVNFHPSLLPKARGVMPLPYIITQDRDAAGFTIHKLTQDFDAGDILYQEAIPITPDTDVETLSAQIAVKAPDAISTVVQDLKNYWANATPQDQSKATTYSAPDGDLRWLNWDVNAKDLSLKAKSFGRYGVLATIKNHAGQSQGLVVSNVSCWEDTHTFDPGALVRSSEREIVVAVKDGFACLKEFHVIKGT